MWCLRDYMNQTVRFYSTEDYCIKAIDFYDLQNISEDYNYYELTDCCTEDDELDRAMLVAQIKALRAKCVEIPLYYLAPVDLRTGIRSDLGDINLRMPFPTKELARKFAARLCTESYDAFDIWESYDNNDFKLLEKESYNV